MSKVRKEPKILFFGALKLRLCEGVKNSASWFGCLDGKIETLSTRRSCCHGGQPELNCQQMSRT